MKVQRQLVTRTPVFYRLEKRENNDSSVGYIHITEFNAVAKKDLVSGVLLVCWPYLLPFFLFHILDAVV
jgi:C-terminal processing protease CtpA/Prc